MITIEYSLNFRSDFHIGSGSGIPGIIDNGMKYDVNGIPEINGKTIKGILRDAVKNLIHIRQENEGQLLLDKLFGKEGNDITCFRFSTPEIMEQYINKIKNNKYLQKKISTVQSRNAINRKTLIAKDKALFFAELAPGFLVYYGSILQTKEIDNQIINKAIFYLISGLRFVTHIGGNRRRGKGLVRFEIDNVKMGSNVLDWKEVIKKGINNNR